MQPILLSRLTTLHRPWYRPRRHDVWWGLGVAAAVLALHFTADPIAALERRLFDAASLMTDRAPLGRVAVIAIDDASIANVGRWPWPREVHAELIDQLAAAGAKTIVHTSAFSEPQTERALAPLRELRSRLEAAGGSSDVYGDLGPESRERLLTYLRDTEQRLDSDARLARSIASAGNVILGSTHTLGVPHGRPEAPLPPAAHRSSLGPATGFGLPSLRAVHPLPVLADGAAAVGHVNHVADPDGTVRQEALVVEYDGRALPSIALAAAAHSLNLAPKDIVLDRAEGVRLGGVLLPTDERARLLPQFYPDRGGRPAFEVDSFYDVIAGRVPVSKYQGRIVLVGPTTAAAGGKTAFATPAGAATPPVLATAHTLSSLLSGHHHVRPAWSGLAQGLAVVLVLGYLVFCLPRLSGWRAAAISAAAVAVLIGGDLLLVAQAHWWVGAVLPAALLLIGHLTWGIRRLVHNEVRRRRADAESAETNRMMGLALQGQGQLDLAFDRLQRVPHSPALMDNLLHLARDFERKRQFNKAEAVCQHMLRLEPGHAAAAAGLRRARQLAQAVVLGPGSSHPGGTLMLGAAEKPMLGRYQVEKELGKGAMGVVYQGRDPKIGRTVAIKTLALSAEFEGQELQDARERFFREAETAGRLQHPNIVTIFDAGEDHDLAYIAMEFLSGQDLTAFTRPGHLLPVDKVLRIGERVALALDHAHRQQVVHRDIKPANVMVDFTTDVVKVTDFGIARVTDSSRTKTGMILGTPSFMSPEQLAGQRVDGRSDLYSLGVTLYQLLTGQLPFRADSMAALMFQIANEPAAAVTVLRPDLPVELARVLQRLLAKSPADRHPSGEALATDLRRIAEQPIAASAHRPRPQDATSSVPRPGRGAPSAPPAATAPLGASEPDFRL